MFSFHRCQFNILGFPLLLILLAPNNFVNMTLDLISEDVSTKAGPGAKGKLRRASSVSAVPGLDKVSHHEEESC